MRFFGRALELKRLYRQGWLRKGVDESRCESVADHSFATALLAWLAARAHRPDLDAAHTLELALIHELGEIGAGDITPDDKVSPDEKRRREEQAVVELCEGLPGGEDILALWREFEYGQSPEALFVRQIDKLEMALQARDYEHNLALSLPEFLASAASTINDPALKALLEAASGNPRD